MDDEDADEEGDEEPAAKADSGKAPTKKSKEKLFKVRSMMCTCQHACCAQGAPFSHFPHHVPWPAAASSANLIPHQIYIARYISP